MRAGFAPHANGVVDMDTEESQVPASNPPRKPYQVPILERYGALEEITQANATGGRNDSAHGSTKT